MPFFLDLKSDLHFIILGVFIKTFPFSLLCLNLKKSLFFTAFVVKCFVCVNGTDDWGNPCYPVK